MDPASDIKPEINPEIHPDGHPGSIPIERLIFRRRHRLSGGEEFAAVFDAKLRKSRGVITVFLLANDLNEHRLGLSVGKRMGNAVVRGRFKRMMREAFRLQRVDLPKPTLGGAYDIVVTARKHTAISLGEYSESMRGAIEAGHRTHEKRTHEKRAEK